MADADLALALGAEFERFAVEEAHAELDELACDLAGFRQASPREQLSACAAAIADRFAVTDELDRVGEGCVLDDLLLHRVLGGEVGHALPLAIAAVEAGRRAGIPLGVVGRGRAQFLAHPALADPHVADLRAPGRLVDLAGREESVSWQCAHQLAALLLNRIAERAERAGDFNDRAVPVSRVRLSPQPAPARSTAAAVTVAMTRAAGQAAAEGTVLTCACAPATEARGTFAQDYKALHGTDPGTYSDTAYDAARILLSGIKAGKNTREAMLEYVKSYNGQGVAANYRFTDNGEMDPAEVRVWAYKVKDGKVVPDQEIPKA